jgi:quercetin dioxygenase-like cupin family protein
MQMTDMPFRTIDWSSVAPTEQKGTSGVAYWRTVMCGGIRMRMVECLPGFVSDHWCTKGHILLCLDGELLTELDDGRTFVLSRGMSFQVADDREPHRSSTRDGAKLFIVD